MMTTVNIEETIDINLFLFTVAQNELEKLNGWWSAVTIFFVKKEI